VRLELLRDGRRWEAHLTRAALHDASPGRIRQALHVDATMVRAVIRMQALARGNRARRLLLKVASLSALSALSACCPGAPRWPVELRAAGRSSTDSGPACRRLKTTTPSLIMP
jgi:hypothetical protein